MKKKILYTLGIIIAVIAMIIGTKVIAGSSLTESSFSGLTRVENYIREFVTNKTREEFLSITWDNIKQNYYTAPGEKGYTPANTKRVVCINDNTSDASDMKLIPVAVIDIEGGRLKAEGSMVNSDASGKWMYIGDKAAAMARVAEYEGSHVNAWVEGFINYDNAGYRWPDFFDTLQNRGIFSKDSKYTNTFKSVHRYFPVGSSYRKIIFPNGNVTGYCNIYTEGSGVGAQESDTVSVIYDSDSNKTLIGNYSLSNLNLDESNIDKKLTITFEDGTESTVGKLVKVSDNEYRIEISGKITKGIKSIKYKQSYRGYKAKIIVMMTNYSQNRLIMDGKYAQIEFEVNLKIPTKNVDVSLQKYIIGTIDGSGNSDIQDTNNTGNDVVQGQDVNYTHEEQQAVEVTETVDTLVEFDNYVMIGDSRTVGIYQDLAHNSIQTDKMQLTYDGKNITFFAKSSIGYDYWFGNESNYARIGKELNTLNSSNEKTKCIIWLGVNDLWKKSAETYINKVSELANTYQNIEFVYYGVGYVNDTKYTYVSNYNTQISTFNQGLKRGIAAKKIENLHYEDFNNKLIICGKKDGRDIIQLRNLGNLIRYDGTYLSNGNGQMTLVKDDISYTDSAGLHYISLLNNALWNQVFSECITKQETITRTEMQTVIVPQDNTNNNTTNNSDTYTPTGRENRYAVAKNSDLYKDESVSYNHAGSEISNHTNRKTVITDFYKINKPVEIEAGDSVVYKIEVYNNKSVDSVVTVSDDFSALGGPEIVEIRTSTSNQFSNATVIGDLTKEEYNENNPDYDGVRYWYDKTNENNKFRFSLAGGATRYIYVTIKYNQYTTEVLRNRAWIPTTTPENHTEYRTIDADYIKMKKYKVSLEKYIAKVNDSNTTGRDGKAEYLTIENGQYVDKTDSDTELTRHNTYKYDNVVTVSKGNTVYYTLKIRNDGDTNVYIPKITDILPTSGVNNNSFKIESTGKYNKLNQKYNYNINAELDATESKDNIKVIKLPTTSTNYMLIPGDYILIRVSVKVTASNMSLETYKNTALITDNKVINRNKVEAIDITPFNNEDSDYFKLNVPPNGPDSSIISGMVWNDTNRIKDNKEEGYNALYDDGAESKLSGIKVYLYRTGTDGRNSPIADTTTDSEGKYGFADKDIYTNIPIKERHIKGPLVSNTVNRWAGAYYSYYIVFEYDGITYTSTPDGQSCINITDTTAYSNGKYKINSNAKEDDSKVKEKRTSFNSKFTKINKDSDIDYDRYIGKTSIEGQEYNIIPQSIHKYDSEKMSMQSATGIVTLADNDVLMNEVKNINLGLRGRDTLDLNVKTEIDNISVKVNGVTTNYVGKNNVTVRKSDMSVGEDAKNFANSAITSGSAEETQDIRQNDLVKTRGSNYKESQLLQSIKVTYKITVVNESKTGISEVSVIDYYDSRYDFKEVRVENCILNRVVDGSRASEYNSKIITTKGNGTIYVTYELKSSAISTLKGLNIDEKLPTYNMAEIYEYTSKAGNNQTEYTRGLIDLDSAPGSVSSEKVILSDDYNGLSVGQKVKVNEGAISSRPTTLQYYFNKTDLQKINYEDDTGVKAVIFRVADDPRTIVGKVFRDNTTVNSDKIKTGNGKFDDGEDIVAGATVELVEYDGNKSPEEISVDEGTVIFVTITNENGEYNFSGYIPGNYIIRYSYGHNDNTVLKNKYSSTLNRYSYNGEDYQSTNNTGSYGAEKLEHKSNFWYITNEQKGVSTAIDNKARRGEVSNNVTNSDSLMTLLNNAKDGKELSSSDVTTIKNNTHMFATTYMMELAGEKADENGNVPNTYGKYIVNNMNFGIAEVPITTIDMQTTVKKFTIKDAAGDNIIAEVTKQNNGEWQVKYGNVLAPKNTQKIDVSIEEQKLQGAKMEVTYDVTANKNIERNYDGKSYVNPVIKGIVDFVDNNLSYNSELGKNKELWEATNLSEIRTKFTNPDHPYGTVVNNDTDFTTIIKATATNPLLTSTESVSCDLILEKTLSSNDATLDDIITSNIEAYDYKNTVEILELDYTNNVSKDGSITFKDRVRTADRHIILAGSQYDYKESEVITIHPPTGYNNSETYYIISIAALGVLAVGIVLIKKYAIKKD